MIRDMTYFIGVVLLLCAGAVILANTRTAQLKRMARTLNLRYDTQVDSVLLPDSSAKAQFFKRGLHQFYHVLTFQDADAFVRVCEDRIFSSPLDKKPLATYTLVAAELTKDTFTPLVLTPRTPGQAPGTNLPPELAARYTLNAPQGFTLPPEVIGFLKAHPTCYVECTPTALLYCELNTVPVARLQPLRFRAMQLLKELAKKPQPAVQAAAAVPSTKLRDEELQAQVLLKLQSAPRTDTQTANDAKYIYGFILLILLGGMLFVAWYALHHWVVR